MTSLKTCHPFCLWYVENRFGCPKKFDNFLKVDKFGKPGLFSGNRSYKERRTAEKDDNTWLLKHVILFVYST